MESLDTIFDKYDTDKGTNFHNYNRQYESLLNKYREKPIKYLEIGVASGGSINAMREVFKNAQTIVGLDINETCIVFNDPSKNVFVEIGNATDSNFINYIIQKYGTFDVILDDGSHVNRDVIKTFELLFPLLNDNGLYIVEDTSCFKEPYFLDANYDNHLNYFFKYTPFLNQWRYDSTEGVRDFASDPFKILKKTDNVFEYSIDKMEYGCGFVAIHKKVRKHWINK